MINYPWKLPSIHCLYQIRFIIYIDYRDISGSQFFQSHICHFPLHPAGLIRIVQYVEQKIRFPCLFQRGTKCFDQCCRKLMDKSNRIRQQKISAASHADPPNSGIQSGKEHIFFKHLFRCISRIFIQKFIHQRGFSCIGITNQCHSWDSASLTLLSLGLPLFCNSIQFFSKFRYSLFNSPAIKFQLFLSGSLIRHTTSTALTTQSFMHACQSWQYILKPCRFHLQLGLSGSCSRCENLKNQSCPIKDRAVQNILQVPHLRWCQ